VKRFLILVPITFLIAACNTSSKRDEEKAADCVEPQNPYEEGSGHYAGFQWAENDNSGTCNGSSDSFNEGCDEYETQETEYQECEAKEH
jgi:hypothetical protein